MPNKPVHQFIDMEAFQEGSVDSFECICYRYMRPLERYCRIIVRDEDIACELVHSILIDCFQQRSRFKTEKELRQFFKTKALQYGHPHFTGEMALT